MKHKKRNSKYLPYLSAVLIILVVFVGGYLVLNQSGFIKSLTLAMQIQQQQALSSEDRKIIQRLEKIINLPHDAKPTMAVITDADKLRQQQPGFFADAQNGNHLIVYPDRAIIYDYAENKIINVGPVNFNNQKI